jgi:GrpB-like predicted nucleotidyltransferase (UPF0157 family)
MTAGPLFRIRHHDPLALKRERTRLHNLVRTATPRGSVLEVGSTAVEGVVGKEDIDFAVSVPRDYFGLVRSSLDRQLKRDPNQLSNSEYQGYILDSPFDAAVQLFVEGSQYDTFESFLQLLLNDVSLRHAYNELKRRWDGKPMDLYRTAKREFIETAISRHS